MPKVIERHKGNCVYITAEYYNDIVHIIMQVAFMVYLLAENSIAIVTNAFRLLHAWAILYLIL